ncbi:MAG: hypothetical protein AAFR96_03740 [Planctomycetota bacterium]
MDTTDRQTNSLQTNSRQTNSRRTSLRRASSAAARAAGAFVAAAGLATGFGGAALGQDALGDGRRLDANQRIGSGGVNSSVRADFSAANALRAAIVTGNAPGGLSFRGDVGYLAPREFRGELASDDLFEFRRDSLYSGLSGLGVRGTDALQYQFALTTGSRPPPSLAGSLAVSRSNDLRGSAASTAASVTSADLGADAFSTESGVTRVDPARVEDTSGTGLWRLRSSAGYLTDRSLSESVVGAFSSEEGDRFGITASPLGGVRIFDVSPQSAAQRDESSGRADVASPAGQPATADTLAGRFTGYDRLVENVEGTLASRTGTGLEGPTGAVALIEEQNRVLQEFLQSVRDESAADLPEAIAGDDTIGSDGEEAPPSDGADAPAERESAAERLARQLEEIGIDRDALDALRGTDLRIGELVDPSTDSDRDFYAIHMNEGRRLMAEGQYFEAEGRFSMALAVREGDPTASIARVHAQIGAGLFLSASLNLRDTLNANPLLIAARFAPGLLPPDARLRAVVRSLNARIDGGGSDARSSALLLAYVGRQLDDRALIQRGLGRLDLDGPDRLSQLLRLVWLDDADVNRALDRVGTDQPGDGAP